MEQVNNPDHGTCSYLLMRQYNEYVCLTHKVSGQEQAFSKLQRDFSKLMGVVSRQASSHGELKTLDTYEADNAHNTHKHDAEHGINQEMPDTHEINNSHGTHNTNDIETQQTTAARRNPIVMGGHSDASEIMGVISRLASSVGEPDGRMHNANLETVDTLETDNKDDANGTHDADEIQQTAAAQGKSIIRRSKQPQRNLHSRRNRPKKQNCKSCNQVLKAKGMHQHYLDMHGGRLCMQCDEVFQTKDDLKDHTKKQHYEVCQICNKNFTNRSNLLRHRRQQHPNHRSQATTSAATQFSDYHNSTAAEQHPRSLPPQPTAASLMQTVEQDGLGGTDDPLLGMLTDVRSLPLGPHCEDMEVWDLEGLEEYIPVFRQADSSVELFA
ncbi:uncharacterized protein BDCG_06911 [Blastomyces dermatitidis ER-3]|uniref:C2H2-type domain-containing protein n=1 Tax=Ajellomyces dermatitidis (strain ER-3 / ATCC MYA-2586) TaxID=559297 RepID=A0ABP2F4A7_AJEDR|nr:uncharacterized protein BDCG_06911 [Blastomyces dermatitidis ER-3]EEQ91791.1 hypothetical protein BDCG_06911 [Blastomyces dermatitidis ER-3]